MKMEIEFPGGKKVNSIYNGVTIESDQPIKYGGDGTAPSPFDLFLGSLGTCAGFYVLSFCKKRGIDMEKVKIEFDIDQNSKTHMVEDIRIHIQLPSDFPEKHKAAVIRSADLCLVKKHLFDPPKFEITAKIGDV